MDKKDVNIGGAMNVRPYDNGNELNRLLRQIKKRREINSNGGEIIRFKTKKAQTAVNSRRGSPVSLLAIQPH